MMRMHHVSVVAACIFLTAAVAKAEEPGPEPYTPPESLAGSWEFTPAAGLPNVLLVGDSITLGYARMVRTELAGEANVFVTMKHGAPINWGNSRKGMRIFFEPQLLRVTWHVVHFNFGLHDICRLHQLPDKSAKKDRDAPPQVPIHRYRTHLDHFAMGMEATGAHLIWATTTVVPENEDCRRVGDEVRYNEAAAEVMKKHGIAVNDLHALSRTLGPEDRVARRDVHFNDSGNRKLARQVASAIRKSLKRPHSGEKTGRDRDDERVSPD